VLHVKHFSFQFDHAPVLRDLHFSVERGGYLSIIGPNGAGKSTLLKCLMRLHEHGRSQGEILVKNQSLDACGQKELARIFSYVPQAGGWIPPFTVEELLGLSRYPYIKTRSGLTDADRQAIEEALALTGMEPLRARGLRALSGGERQKAFLAAALAQQTEMLLLDAPASFLDPKHAAELNRLLQRLNRERGLTLITVTHDVNHPLCMEGHALVLREGRQLYFGQADGLLRQEVLESAYAHPFTYFEHPRTGRPAILAD
jgi:iron complex transport system ATP-binding protein